MRRFKFRGALFRDPVLLVYVGGALVVATWLLVAGAELAYELRVSWLTQLVLDTSLAVFAFRIARRPDLPRQARPFYRAITFTGVCFAVGDVSQIVIVFARAGPDAATAGPIQTASFLVGVTAAVAGVLLYPTAVRTVRERLRFWLDAATVLLGGAALAWALAAEPGVDRVSGLIAAGLVLVATFASTKLLYADAAPMTRIAVLPCIASAVTQGVGIFASSALGAQEHAGAAQALQVLAAMLIGTGFRIQELEFAAGLHPRRRKLQRSHNKLPYVATLAAAGTLVAVLPRSAGPKAWGVLLAVVVISVLVSIRQIDAFADNQALIQRLDKSLAALGQNERWYRSLLQHSTDITLVVDADGVLTFTSPAVKRVLGLSPDEALGLRLADLLHPDDREATDAAFRKLRARQGGTMTISARYRHADGSWRWLDGASTNLLEMAGVGGVVCNARDVTEARRFRDQLQHEATHDPLTGLPNRALFNERLAAGASGPCALLLVDLDDFKLINDVHGHPAGDAVLVAVAGRLRECARPGDTPARLGGDEFAVVLPETTPADAEAVAERFRTLLRAPIEADGDELAVGASVGVGVGTALGSEALLSIADQAMYRVKRAGRAAEPVVVRSGEQ
ncbi:diguanylate cyclase domain-containing protein [Cryptosporangium arvum]|uniref:PAS domain S-box/diguanylate cyclase (GGDEF) domain-containing protein n=1 Tax=Cryptosporangium arvum DSM 44712 TaxID=927661 RepID=A0A010YJ88_9ACTN|nr:diguanylate cyclase [Cryptosporangium arvum]EXG80260.1 PAS domain S-box/diguanylate cyclase (GGDEF) domain-containing protein [Cryptosporangium arvum DSM 44712]